MDICNIIDDSDQNNNKEFILSTDVDETYAKIQKPTMEIIEIVHRIVEENKDYKLSCTDHQKKISILESQVEQLKESSEEKQTDHQKK